MVKMSFSCTLVIHCCWNSLSQTPHLSLCTPAQEPAVAPSFLLPHGSKWLFPRLPCRGMEEYSLQPWCSLCVTSHHKQGQGWLLLWVCITGWILGAIGNVFPDRVEVWPVLFTAVSWHSAWQTIEIQSTYVRRMESSALSWAWRKLRHSMVRWLAQDHGLNNVGTRILPGPPVTYPVAISSLPSPFPHAFPGSGRECGWAPPRPLSRKHLLLSGL